MTAANKSINKQRILATALGLLVSWLHVMKSPSRLKTSSGLDKGCGYQNGKLTRQFGKEGVSIAVKPYNFEPLNPL